MIPEIQSEAFDKFVEPFIKGTKKVNEKSPAVDHARCIALHAEGSASNPKLRELLDRRRPNESEPVKEHRLANFRGITKSEFERIENTMHIIFNPRNFNITWPEMAILQGIDSMGAYFTEHYPKYQSLTKYFEQSLFHNIMIDPNGIALILPFVESDDMPIEGRMIRPFPYFIETREIIEQTDDYVVIIQDGNFILVDKAVVITGIRKEQNGKIEYNWNVIFEHNLNLLPIIEMPGVEKSNESIFGEKCIKESYVAGVLPYWDKALMNDTDRDAVQILYTYPKFWQWKTKCETCKGSGKVAKAGFADSMGFINCHSCGGSGEAKGHGPHDKFIIDPKELSEKGITPPPFGYEAPPDGILAHIKETVRENINDGFGALNMHHLAIDTTGESGTSKIVGRKDLNTMMLKISNGVWDCWKEIVKISSMIRYGPSGQYRPDELPDVERPVEFDIYTSDELTSKIASATTAGMDKSYIKLLQIETAKKDFGETSAPALFFVALQELDPFPNATSDDMMTINSVTKKLDRIVHANINNLINSAMQKNNGFLYMDRTIQRKIVYELASEIDTEIKNQNAMIPTPGIVTEPEPGTDNDMI